MITITIDAVLQSYIDPLTASEHAALERSLLAEGCRDALVLWNGILIDGHNRYAICRQHAIAFATLENASFASIDDVKLWIIDNHLARRSVSDFQRGVLALRKKDIVAARIAQQPASASSSSSAAAIESAPRPSANSREEIAQLARLSSNTMVQIEKIQKAATPELVAAVRSGTISINAAAIVASLPEAAQLVAVAGGKKQMQQAAREVREQKSKARAPRELVAEMDGHSAPLRAEIAVLQQTNAALKAANVALEQRIAALIDAT